MKKTLMMCSLLAAGLAMAAAPVWEYGVGEVHSGVGNWEIYSSAQKLPDGLSATFRVDLSKADGMADGSTRDFAKLAQWGGRNSWLKVGRNPKGGYLFDMDNDLGDTFSAELPDAENEITVIYTRVPGGYRVYVYANGSHVGNYEAAGMNGLSFVTTGMPVRNAILSAAVTDTLTIVPDPKLAAELTPETLSDAQKAILAKVASVRPTPAQLAWQRLELTAFFHFGANTYTDREWGTGKEDPKIFNPGALDCDQWAKAIKAAGFKLAILTAKHHDGFCLWPSDVTDHDVASSPWKNGQGDLVREFADAMRANGIKVGLYLSPWDMHEPAYGQGKAYDDFFVAQLTELLTRYGKIDEMWFDGACGEGPNGKRQVYDWARYYKTIRELAPECLIAVSGPDVRWVGNESGLARESEWSVVPIETIDNDAIRAGFEDFHYANVDAAKMSGPKFNAKSPKLGCLRDILRSRRAVWYPAECDVSIRPGWFYHASQDNRVKTLDHLMTIYDSSVGRNSVLLLNIPPNKDGLVHPNDVNRLAEFGRIVRDTFSVNLLGDVKPGQTEVTLAQPVTFDTLTVQEDIAQGQLIERFRVEARIAGQWKEIARSTTVGHKRILRLKDPVTADGVRIVVESTRATPHLLTFGAHRDARRR